MAKSESRLLSGRIKTKTGNSLDPRRSDFLSLDNAEPNFGNPDSDRYILASLADGTRLFLKLNNGFIVNADSVSGDETTFVIDPSGLANANGTTLSEVLDNLDSAITVARNFGTTVADSNFEGLGTAADPLRLDSDLNVFKLSADSISSSILTENRVVIVGPNGLLEDDGNLTYDGTKLTVSPNTSSTNATSGSLVVTGGVGISENLHVAGNIEVIGNFAVSGTTTTVDVQTLAISDPLIHLADSNEASDEEDIGFVGHYSPDGGVSKQHTGFFRDATTSEYYVFATYQDSSLDSSPRSNIIDRSSPSFSLAGLNAKSLTVDSEVNASTFVGNGAGITDINADNITTGDLPLGTRTSGNYVQSVTAGFGIETLAAASEGTQHTVTVDSSAIKGLFSSGANINYNSISGEISVTTSGVVAGTYGASNRIPVISVDSFGQVDSIGLVIPTTSLGDTVDSMSFNSLTGVITLTTDVASFPVQLGLAPFDTDSLAEGSTNLYYTTARVDSDILSKVDSDYVRARADSDYIKSVTGINADTLDTLNSTSFLRSDADTIKTAGYLRLNDNLKLTFGTSFNDLEIFNDGSNSFISEVGTGDLYITTNGQEVLIKDSENGKLSAEFIPSGEVDLYYNGAKKLNTSDTGVTITGIVAADSGTLAGNRILTTADFGPGNGINADLLDGVSSEQFLRSDQDDSMAGTLFIDDSLSANNITRRNTTVVAGTYGSGSAIPVVTVDASGFVDSIGSVTVATVLNTSAETGTGTVNLLDSSLEIAAGVGIDTVSSGNTITVEIDSADLYAYFNHDDFFGFVANEHIDHSSVSITAGAGLTGGGDITSSRTLNVVGGDGITANADEIKVTVDNSTIELSATNGSGAVRVKDLGITNAKLAGSIENAKLSNSSVTVGSTEIALGETSTTLAGLTQLNVDNIRIDGNTISSTAGSYMYIDPHPVDSAGTLVILGNLSVEGTTTTIKSTTVSINDKNIVLADSASNATEANGAGITVGTYASNPTITYDGSTDRWDFSKPIEVSTVHGALSGNASTATALASSQNFSLTGDVTATAVGFDGQGNVELTTVYNPGSIVNEDINASAAIADTKLATISTPSKVSNSATTATNANTINAIVARDGSGNFSAGTITAALSGNASTATALASSQNFSISGDITASAVGFNGTGAVALSAAITAGSIVNDDINASAAIADTKLATISTSGKVSNAATTATSANTNSAIVARDGSGNFTAGTITADLDGNATTATTATNANNVAIIDNTSDNSTHYVHFGDATSGYDNVQVSSSKLTFNPSSGTLQVNGISVATTADLTASTSPNFSVDSAYFGTGVLTNGEGKAIYYDTSSSKWEGAYNDSSGEFTATHIIVDKTATDVKIASTGIFTVSGGLSANNYYFLSSTAGTTTNDPDSAPTVFQPLYYALDANTIDVLVQAPQDTVITTYPYPNNPGEEVHGGPIIYSGIPSDERLKENIESIQSDAISLINQLNPVSFDFKDPISKYHEGQQLGFIAQEISEVIPQSVYTEDDEINTMMLKPETVIPVLTKAIQELTETVETLKKKVEDLETR